MSVCKGSQCHCQTLLLRFKFPRKLGRSKLEYIASEREEEIKGEEVCGRGRQLKMSEYSVMSFILRCSWPSQMGL